MIVGAGFAEETLFRGYLFERLGKLFGTGAGAKVSIVLLTSALFALGHYSNLGLPGVEQAMITASSSGTIFAITGRIWMVMCAHASFFAPSRDSFRRDELHGSPVHAVAQARGLRAVVEDVAEVRVAAAAHAPRCARRRSSGPPPSSRSSARSAARSSASRCPSRTSCRRRRGAGRSTRTVYVPFAWLSQFGPVNARSVPFFRVTWNCSGVRSFFHSASVLTTRSGGRRRSGGIGGSFLGGALLGTGRADRGEHAGAREDGEGQGEEVTSSHGHLTPTKCVSGPDYSLATSRAASRRSSRAMPDAVRDASGSSGCTCGARRRRRGECPSGAPSAGRSRAPSARGSARFASSTDAPGGARRNAKRESSGSATIVMPGIARTASAASRARSSFSSSAFAERREAAELDGEPDLEPPEVARELRGDLAEVHGVRVVLHAGHVVRRTLCDRRSVPGSFTRRQPVPYGMKRPLCGSRTIESARCEARR